MVKGTKFVLILCVLVLFIGGIILAADKYNDIDMVIHLKELTAASSAVSETAESDADSDIPAKADPQMTVPERTLPPPKAEDNAASEPAHEAADDSEAPQNDDDLADKSQQYAVGEASQQEIVSRHEDAVPDKAPAEADEHVSDNVYIAASGKGTKYHKNPNCSNMNGNVNEMTREDAEAAGYTPCKKCFR